LQPLSDTFEKQPVTYGQGFSPLRPGGAFALCATRPGSANLPSRDKRHLRGAAVGRGRTQFQVHAEPAPDALAPDGIARAASTGQEDGLATRVDVEIAKIGCQAVDEELERRRALQRRGAVGRFPADGGPAGIHARQGSARGEPFPGQRKKMTEPVEFQLVACRPGCSCGKFFEIWNDVFMQYRGTPDGRCEPLGRHNVDTGMGVERTVAMLQGKASVFETELFAPVVAVLEEQSGRRMDASPDVTRAFRVVSDHLRSAVFILGDVHGILPGNLGQGYVLRRLIRRSVRYGKQLGLAPGFTRAVAEAVIASYAQVYGGLLNNRAAVLDALTAEEEKFEKTLSRGMGELDKVLENMARHGQTELSGRVAFRLYDTCGFPLEFTQEICAERGVTVDTAGFDKAFAKHRAVSKQGADRAFKGGLADGSDATTRLHTATHLLHKALQIVLGNHVAQKGSNITPERLRFDFSHAEKMTPEQIAEVERIVNEQIERDLPVTFETMTLDEARASGATALFSGKYGEQVKVYAVGDYSKEVCGGPHVRRTGALGRFRIRKEESSSAGVRDV
jgi:alanyl-tRNA synthetase